jgi:hypothetical protein
MPAKAKAASTSSLDDVKPSASTPSNNDALLQILARLDRIDSRFNALEAEVVQLRAAQVIQPPAPAPAIVPAIVPAVTPAFEPSASFKSIPFRADEVGYFDPDLDANAEGDMVTVGKDLWFRDVFLFTDRLKDIATTKADVVRANWTACLRGTALS